MVNRRPRITIPVVREDAMTFSAAVSKCLGYLEGEQEYSERTVDNYRLTCGQFVAYLRLQKQLDALDSFTTSNIHGFLSWLTEQGVGANTRLNKLCALQALSKYLMGPRGPKDAKDRPLLTFDPTTAVERPRRVTPKTEFLRPAHVNKVRRAEIYAYQRLLFDVLLDTGIRASEAVDADVDNLQELDGETSIVVPVKGRKQANAEPGVYPVSAEVAGALWASLRERGVKDMPTAPLLVNHEGQRWRRTAMGECIAWVGRRAGIVDYRLSPHKLRHTANVVAAMAGISAPERAAMLNHRSQSTLARYDHIVGGSLHQARAKQRAALQSYCDSALGQINGEVNGK